MLFDDRRLPVKEDPSNAPAPSVGVTAARSSAIISIENCGSSPLAAWIVIGRALQVMVHFVSSRPPEVPRHVQRSGGLPDTGIRLAALDTVGVDFALPLDLDF